MTLRGPVLLLAAALLGPAPLAAQDPLAPPAPAVRAPADTAAASDSAAADSFAAVLPPLGPVPGPSPPRQRLVFDLDALRFSGALTLGELLARVPGTFLVRAGWFGMPEVLHLAGQGGASVEVYWDGLALDPMGEDSAGLDLGRLPLGLFRRVEVEVWPTVLRVHLVSDTQPVLRPRTETSFATGDAATNTYRIRYLNRGRGGPGVGIGVNWFGTDGPITTPVSLSDLTLWAKGTWAPSPRTGFEAQVARYSLRRDPLPGLLPGRNVRRSDVSLRAHAATRDDGMGLRFDALLGASTYHDSTTDTETRLAQAGAFAGFAAPHWSWSAGVRVRDDRIPLEVEARAAAAPLRGLDLSGHLRRRWLLGERRELEVGLAVEARLIGPLLARGLVRHRSAVSAPAIPEDTAQEVEDWSAGLVVRTAALDLDVGLESHGDFAAAAYGVFSGLVPRGTVTGGRTVTARLSARPAPYLGLEGWYRHPLGTPAAAYEPPHHARVAATFRSRFLPRFRRGVLDVVLQVGGESWSGGVMGAATDGAAIALDGHGAVDWLVEVRLLGAVIYWTLRNATNSRYVLVPGVPMARGLQRYGVRWEFTN